MSLFRYVAVDHRGETVEGSFNGSERAQLLSILREKQLIPVKVTEMLEKKDIKELDIFKGSVKMKDLAVFCRQFSTMISAGVTIVKCLDILQSQTENRRLKAAAKETYHAVQKGRTLSEAMKSSRDAFPDLMIHMVEAGEASGMLDSILRRMAVYFEKENRTRSKIRSAMVYPSVLAVIATLVVVFLLTFIMPMFIGMFQSSGVALPVPTRILLALSKVIRNQWMILLPCLLVITYILRKYIGSENGRHALDRLKLRIPVIRGSVRKIITGRFTRTLSTLLASGMPLLQAMEVVSRVVNNRVAEEAILKAREEMRKGMDLAGPIKRSGMFPPMVDSMIRIGEESGSLDEILESSADFFEEEVESAIQRLVSLLDPLMILVMAGIIGFIVISIALPMFDMMKTIQ